jgi:outer membrane protein assembly factor BamA
MVVVIFVGFNVTAKVFYLLKLKEISAHKTYWNIWIILSVLFLFTACSQTRLVPEKKYLLSENQLTGNLSNKIKLELKNCLLQKPSRPILVSLYSASNPEKNNWWNRTLRSFGEEPVILDLDYTEQSVSNLYIYLAKKGYYNASVSDSIAYKRRKAKVYYKISPGIPYTIRNFNYQIDDSVVRHFVFADSANNLIKRGRNYDESVLTQERSRIEGLLQDNGYYKFTRDFISYYVDTTLGVKKVDIVLNIRNYEEKTDDSTAIVQQHPQYKIRQVIVNTASNVNVPPIDTVKGPGLLFTYNDKHFIKPGILQQSNYIIPDSLFRLSDVDKTKAHLSSLRVFSLVNANQFRELPPSDTSRFRYLDGRIQLIPVPMQSYQWELEGTVSASDYAGALNLVYQHRSLFGNAENFTLKLKGALGTDQQGNITQFNRIVEYGADASLQFPKFILPFFTTAAFTKKYNPSTIISLSYMFQERRYYTCYGANASFGYQWRSGQRFRHTINPFEINVVYVPRKDEAKLATWGVYAKNRYSNHIISAISYIFEYRPQDAEHGKTYSYLRAHIETAGNALSLYSKFYQKNQSQNTYYTLLNTRFSQYTKNDIDFRVYHDFSSSKKIASRLFAGCAYPYGNANSVPFEKQYSGGGANSLRGWNEASLGLGSLKDTAGQQGYIKGDVKIEANLEYRNSLFWILEGALFVDAGNVWALSPDVASQGRFSFNRFYNEFAVSSGVGLRFNITFTVLRLDLGMKVRTPSAEAGKKWFYQQRVTWTDDFTIAFGIDYPF